MLKLFENKADAAVGRLCEIQDREREAVLNLYAAREKARECIERRSEIEVLAATGEPRWAELRTVAEEVRAAEVTVVELERELDTVRRVLSVARMSVESARESKTRDLQRKREAAAGNPERQAEATKELFAHLGVTCKTQPSPSEIRVVIEEVRTPEVVLYDPANPKASQRPVGRR